MKLSASIKAYCSSGTAKRTVPVTVLCFAVLWYLLCLPREMFRDVPCSTVVLDRNGELLGARISDDGQWRFPPSDSIPYKFAEAIILFEDRHFREHPGVNPASLTRAAIQNIRAGKTVSGGSTLTMQTIRLWRGGKRNIFNKLVEIILATRLELRYTKDEILAMYASYAPFGGNVVGIEAAAWRYFGRSASELSWAEAATLAVLPNAPSAIHPGKNRDALRAKRDRLLERLLQYGKIDSTDFTLAVSEPLPQAPLPLPELCYHLTEAFNHSSPGTMVKTGIDSHLQQSIEGIVTRWHKELSDKGINDLAAIVIDVNTSQIVAYCGNASPAQERPGAKVNIPESPRSTGSILKPLLYCALLQQGSILPHTLLPDIPVNINGFSPQNFDMKFYGAVPADKALARSLNVPSVHMLRRYGVGRFHELLREAGMTTLNREASHYGLSLILGGAEGKLAEITSIYASMARVACRLPVREGFPLNDPVAVWLTLEALKEVNRPDEMDWRLISSVAKVAWKTGTSYGFRDGWAIGVTPGYAVGVWAGNAQGHGVSGLTGASSAGPVMFDIFNTLPSAGWFTEPYTGYVYAEICRRSGHLKGRYCTDTYTAMIPQSGLASEPCPYHRSVRVTSDGKYRLPAGHPGHPQGVQTSMFVLPAAMEWFYRQWNPEYRPMPPMLPSSVPDEEYIPMEFIYPQSGSLIHIPRQLDGSTKGIIFTLAHSDSQTTVYWHLDGHYAAQTKHIHQISLTPSEGKHTLTAVDSQGNTLSVSFECTNSDGR